MNGEAATETDSTPDIDNSTGNIYLDNTKDSIFEIFRKLKNITKRTERNTPQIPK